MWKIPLQALLAQGWGKWRGRHNVRRVEESRRHRWSFIRLWAFASARQVLQQQMQRLARGVETAQELQACSP